MALKYLGCSRSLAMGSILLVDDHEVSYSCKKTLQSQITSDRIVSSNVLEDDDLHNPQYILGVDTELV
jgi:hypothetical protein